MNIDHPCALGTDFHSVFGIPITNFQALGTHNGVVYILNHRIELIKRFRPHSATIYDIKIEVAEQFIATASMDGKISIVQLAGGNDVFILDLKRPMMAVAMEPLYHKHPNKRLFISGGLAGNLTLHEKGWLGNKETILHSDEGSIWSAEWKNNLVVWANDTVGFLSALLFLLVIL